MCRPAAARSTNGERRNSPAGGCSAARSATTRAAEALSEVDDAVRAQARGRGGRPARPGRRGRGRPRSVGPGCRRTRGSPSAARSGPRRPARRASGTRPSRLPPLPGATSTATPAVDAGAGRTRYAPSDSPSAVVSTTSSRAREDRRRRRHGRGVRADRSGAAGPATEASATSSTSTTTARTTRYRDPPWPSRVTRPSQRTPRSVHIDVAGQPVAAASADLLQWTWFRPAQRLGPLRHGAYGIRHPVLTGAPSADRSPSHRDRPGSPDLDAGVRPWRSVSSSSRTPTAACGTPTAASPTCSRPAATGCHRGPAWRAPADRRDRAGRHARARADHQGPGDPHLRQGRGAGEHPDPVPRRRPGRRDRAGGRRTRTGSTATCSWRPAGRWPR